MCAIGYETTVARSRHQWCLDSWTDVTREVSFLYRYGTTVLYSIEYVLGFECLSWCGRVHVGLRGR